MARVTDLARADLARMVEGDDWGVDLIISPLFVDGEFSIKGLSTNHTELYDPDDGTKSLQNSSHCNFMEKTLNDLGVVTRDGRGRVNVDNWIVKKPDATGTLISYVIREAHPDTEVGCIRCILEIAEV